MAKNARWILSSNDCFYKLWLKISEYINAVSMLKSYTFEWDWNSLNTLTSTLKTSSILILKQTSSWSRSASSVASGWLWIIWPQLTEQEHKALLFKMHTRISFLAGNKIFVCGNWHMLLQTENAFYKKSS